MNNHELSIKVQSAMYKQIRNKGVASPVDVLIEIGAFVSSVRRISVKKAPRHLSSSKKTASALTGNSLKKSPTHLLIISK
jgi:hypothetical protein